MKKICKIFVLLSMFAAAFMTNSLGAQTAEEFSVSVTRDGTGIIITGYSGRATAVTIPQNIQGLPVKEIGTRAFRNTVITTITIPQGVTIIGANGFSGSDKLYSVTLPPTLVTIGREAFQGCTALTSIAIPRSVTSIEQSAFANTGLRSVTWPASVAEIADYMFRECHNLTTVVLPEGLTRIGTGAFYRCPALTEINMPSTLTGIANLAFTGATAIPLGTQAAIRRAGYRGNF